MAGDEETRDAPISSQEEHNHMQIFEKNSSSHDIQNIPNKQIVSVMESQEEKIGNQQIVCIGQHTEPDLSMTEVQQDEPKSLQTTSPPFQASNQPLARLRVGKYQKSRMADCLEAFPRQISEANKSLIREVEL
ncbi:ribosomal protein S12 methylthiotransferase RimO [Striga asiatica]|uniref:Ribosomal protein S12 methylthiotransferase RimO n=1 Tax=Striga asiatica TaxID=4170 RepID=A0A5A7R3C0_STRAF|nr:ribosomal protein S12 methylthiotransferase RimO [Striga asiatica]